MRRLLWAAPAVLLIFVAASGRQGARQSGGVEQLVLQAEARIAEAVRLKDLATLQASLADEFLLTVDTGAVLSKAQFIDGIRKSGGGDVPDEEVLTEADEVRVHVYGGVAVLSCRRSIVDSLIIGEFSGQWRETSVFVNRQGRWLLASSQRTLIRLR